MSKPVSRPNEVGRAIGYNVDIDLLREKLSQASLGQWDHLKTNSLFLEQVGRAAELKRDRPPGSRRLWVVLKVEREVPVMIDAYGDKRSAKKRARFLQQHMRPDLDQVALLEIKL